jgi:hypothetical protein
MPTKSSRQQLGAVLKRLTDTKTDILPVMLPTKNRGHIFLTPFLTPYTTLSYDILCNNTQHLKIIQKIKNRCKYRKNTAYSGLFLELET